MKRSLLLWVTGWAATLLLSFASEFYFKDHLILSHTRFHSIGLHAMAFILGLTLLILAQRQNIFSLYKVVCLFGLLLAVRYGMATAVPVRQADGEAHLIYVKYIEEKLALPNLDFSWETYHPPVYHVLGAAWDASIRVIFSAQNSYGNLQALSFLVFGVTVVISTLLFGPVLAGPSSKQQNIGTALIGLLLFTIIPAHVYFSARVNNDVLMPLLGVVSLFLALQYYNNPGWRTAFAGGLVGAVSFLTKFNGIVLIAAFTLVVFFRRNEKWRHDLAWAALPPIMVIFLWMVHSYFQTGHFIYSNLDGPFFRGYGAQLVPNTAGKFLWVNLKALWREPYNTIGGELRGSIASTALATAFHDDEFFPQPLAWLVAARMFFLPLLISGLFWLFTKAKSDNTKRVVRVYVFIMYLFFAVVNFMQPLGCQADFRYFAPAFLALGCMISGGATQASRFSPRLSWVGHVMTISATLTTAAILALYCKMLVR